VKILNLSGQIHTYGFAIDNLVFGEKEAASVTAAAGNGAVAAGADLCSIVFDKVSFSYGDRIILRDQEMVINAGEFVGISGVSGKGKTTIIHLLLGFLAPESGQIIINGENTDQAARQGYWSRIAYVKQQPFLLSDTVGKNITLSDEDIDEHRLMEIIKATGLDTLGVAPEKQSAKMITENGKNISGGQRQRIAFARALYKNADLFILDEPFSELDEQSERKMLDICLQLTRKGKAVVLITHNRSNLLFCHKTLLLDEG
jgi:ABC-type multidrug transport system fused ATPase/permease subunit